MSKIEWCDTTWNPITGCDKISPGCDNCYALTLAGRLQAMGNPRYQNDGHPTTSGPGFGLTVHWDKFSEPYRWVKPRMVFVNSMSDLFHPSVPGDVIDRLVYVMGATPQHTYQVLTKRPQRMVAWANSANVEIPRNIWWGVSVESNDWVQRRVPPLLEFGKVAGCDPVLFASVEPLIGDIWRLDPKGLDWIIVGGESGPGARPLEPRWVRELIRCCMCREDAVPVFLKQWGTYRSNPLVAEQGLSIAEAKLRDPPENGKGGALLDGVLLRDYPYKWRRESHE